MVSCSLKSHHVRELQLQREGAVERGQRVPAFAFRQARPVDDPRVQRELGLVGGHAPHAVGQERLQKKKKCNGQ